MKTTLLATSLLGISLAACSDEADIGVNSDPITCMTAPAADMAGSVDYNGQTYKFSNAIPSLTRDTNGTITTLSLWSSENPDTQRGNYLRFYFQCGQAEVASYDVVAGTDQQLSCPHEVSSSVLGSIEILPATEGVLIVDEMSSCLAGRFRVDLDSDHGGGALGGWFSVPLQ
ncbi:MAG TPA: hypothetical protein VIV11_31005 [Kofleriaceae bacterium]